MSNKTIWQKFYSFFGFWTYTECVFVGNGNVQEYNVLYWTFLPFGKFYRKFDIVRWKCLFYNVREELTRLNSRIDRSYLKEE